MSRHFNSLVVAMIKLHLRTWWLVVSYALVSVILFWSFALTGSYFDLGLAIMLLVSTSAAVKLRWNYAVNPKCPKCGNDIVDCLVSNVIEGNTLQCEQGGNAL